MLSDHRLDILIILLGQHFAELAYILGKGFQMITRWVLVGFANYLRDWLQSAFNDFDLEEERSAYPFRDVQHCSGIGEEVALNLRETCLSSNQMGLSLFYPTSTNPRDQPQEIQPEHQARCYGKCPAC